MSEEERPEDGKMRAKLEDIQKFKEYLKEREEPFLDLENNQEVYPNEFAALKHRRVLPLTDTNPLITVFGPKVDRGAIPEQTQIFGERVCAQTISTYPLQTQLGGHSRDGDPVCDRYGFYLFTNRSIVVVADGCNWGERPKRAAERARNSVMGYLKEKNPKIKTVDDANLYLLRSFNEAHNRICEKLDPDEEIGSTTLLAGISLEVAAEKDGDPNEWIFVCASVGDCKAFLIRGGTRHIVDITMNNRFETKSATDCGGRLGPVMPGGGPDLRNLVVYCCRVQIGDMIMVMSDGVHDNLHPATLSISPEDLKLRDWKTWDDVEGMDTEEIASRFRVKYFQYLLGAREYTPFNLLDCSIEHSDATTASSRRFMETRSGKLPSDYSLYPGKMDHTTCVVFRVGSADFQNPSSPQLAASSDDLSHSNSCIPISVTLSINRKTFTIYCRTIAKGKFECLPKENECVLTVSPRKPFSFLPGEELCGVDELSIPSTRVVKIPKNIKIDVESKEISYDSTVGIISIRFKRILE